MPRLDRRISRLERARPVASGDERPLDLSAVSTDSLREIVRARRDDGTIALDRLTDTALAELEAAVIAQRGLADET